MKNDRASHTSETNFHLKFYLEECCHRIMILVLLLLYLHFKSFFSSIVEILDFILHEMAWNGCALMKLSRTHRNLFSLCVWGGGAKREINFLAISGNVKHFSCFKKNLNCHPGGLGRAGRKEEEWMINLPKIVGYLSCCAGLRFYKRNRLEACIHMWNIALWKTFDRIWRNILRKCTLNKRFIRKVSNQFELKRKTFEWKQRIHQCDLLYLYRLE